MNYQSFNPNPQHKKVGDCVIRAICKALNKEWEEVYTALCLEGFIMNDLPNSNAVWGAYLRKQGFERCIIPSKCPDCYTVNDFCVDYPKGNYILAISGHVVAVQDGKLYDSWDSSFENPVYYWQKKEN